MINGISHLTFVVQNLELSSDLFVSVFGAREIYTSGNYSFSLSPEKFFLIGDLWICLMEGKEPITPTYNHVAFKVSVDDLPIYENRVRALNLKIKPSRPRLPAEGQSLYFYDYDNHLFELHAGTLSERMSLYNEFAFPI